MKPVIYITDVESTGKDSSIHDIIELAVIRLVEQTDGSYSEEEKHWLVKATNPKTIEDEALKVNGHKREDILWLTKFGKENYRLPEDVLQELDDWIMTDEVSSIDRIFAGQNPLFDLGFWKELYLRCQRNPDDFPFLVNNNNRVLDTKQLVLFIDTLTGIRRRYYNLGSFIKAFSIKKEKAHTALGDTRMTKNLLVKIITELRPSITDRFTECYLDEDKV